MSCCASGSVQRGELSQSELREILEAIQTLPIRLCEHDSLLLPACALAEAHGLGVYDARIWHWPNDTTHA